MAEPCIEENIFEKLDIEEAKMTFAAKDSSLYRSELKNVSTLASNKKKDYFELD